MDVEKPKMKMVERDERKELPDEHQSLSNILVLVIVIAASGMCVYMYNVTLRVYRLEQRFQMISHRYDGSSASAKPVVATPRSFTDRQRQNVTVTESPTTSSSAATKSFASVSSTPITDRDRSEKLGKIFNDIDGGLKTYGDREVGSGLLKDEDDDEDGELSGKDGSYESYDSLPSSYKFISEWYQFDGSHGRHKRSSDATLVSDDASRRRHHHRQQQQQNQRRGASHRATPSHDSAESNPTDTTRQHQRRRDRRRSERRRQRLETSDGQFAQLFTTRVYRRRVYCCLSVSLIVILYF